MGDAASPTQVIAKRVRELRREREWTAERLADEVTKAGVKWNRGTVAKLENGRRDSVSVEELFALAWAFGVPPVVLVLPDDSSAAYEVTPSVVAEAERAFAWLAGFLPPTRTALDAVPDADKSRADVVRYFASMPGYMRSARALEQRMSEEMPLDEFEAVMRSRAVPMDRRQQINADWWTPERQAAHQRATFAAEFPEQAAQNQALREEIEHGGNTAQRNVQAGDEDSADGR